MEYSAEKVQQPRSGSDLGTFTLKKQCCLDEHVRNSIKSTCLDIPSACPEILTMFSEEERNKSPPSSLDPWAGSHVGALMILGSNLYRLTQDGELKGAIDKIVNSLCSNQSQHGYIGPWPSSHEFKRDAPNCEIPWDAWSHYWIMVGASQWGSASSSSNGGMLAGPIADLLILKFGTDTSALHSLGAHASCGALTDAFAALYLTTDMEKYILASKTMAKFLKMPGLGDFVKLFESNKPFTKGQNNKWEALVTLMGLAKLGQIGDADFQIFESTATALWWSICESSRCANGAILIGDQELEVVMPGAAPRSCSTGIWGLFTAEVLNLIGSSIVADELELTIFNAGATTSLRSEKGLPFSDIPLSGTATEVQKKLSQATIFGDLALSSIAECGIKSVQESIIINLFSASTFNTTLASGNEVTLIQETEYPHSQHVNLVVKPKRRGEPFTICIRVPAWAENSCVKVDLTTANQPEVHNPETGKYFCLERDWCSGDRISIDFNFALRAKKAPTDNTVNLYYGPLLLAVDDSVADNAQLVKQAVLDLEGSIVDVTTQKSPAMTKIKLSSSDNSEHHNFCDYVSARRESKVLTTSVQVTNSVEAVTFSRFAPMCTFTVRLNKSNTSKESKPSSVAKVRIQSPPKSKFNKKATKAEKLQAKQEAKKKKSIIIQRKKEEKAKAREEKKSVRKERAGRGAKQKVPPQQEKVESLSNDQFSAQNQLGDADNKVVDLQETQSAESASTQTDTDKFNPANAPAEADLQELFEAKAMQDKLRQIKKDMEDKAAAVAGHVPSFTSPTTTRKKSTRDMLSSVSGVHDIVAPANTQAPSEDKKEPIANEASSATEDYQIATGDETAAVTDDYQTATGDEIPSAQEVAKPNAVQEPPPSAWKESENALEPKPSWKQSWRKIFKKSGKPKADKNQTPKPSKKKKSEAKNPFAPKSTAKSDKGSTGPTCFFCEKPVFSMEKGEADGMVFHKTCFRCAHCKKIVKLGNYAALEGKIYCKPHFKQLFMSKGNYNEGFGSEQHKHKWERGTSDGGAGEAAEVSTDAQDDV